MIIATRSDYTLQVQGHAGQGAHGHDIVCAAASMLFFALADTLRKDAIPYEISAESGNGIIVAYPQSEFTFDADCYFKLVCNGYRALAREHPENITFNDDS